MNKLILSFLFMMTVATASSQKVYFVYLQADPGQPFFVKMSEKVYSSTASGYLILSKLHDSSYNFSVGFPQNKWPEQKFSVVVNKKDHGYLLKNFGEKGWGLFDLQTMAIQMSTAVILKTDATAPTGKQNVSVFTDILAKAADDPSLMEKLVQPMIVEKKPDIAIQPVEKKEEPKAEPAVVQVIKPVEITEQPAVKKEVPKAEEKVVTETKPAEITEQPVVKKEVPKAEEKVVTETKTAVVTEEPVVKKEVPKEEKVVTETKTAAVIEEPVVKKEVPKAEEKVLTETKPVGITEQPVEKKEEPKAEIKEIPVTTTEEIKPIPAEEYKPSIVTRRSESSTTEGFGLVFIDDYQNGIKDTIRLIIPNPKPVVKLVKEEPKEEKKFLDISAEASKKEEEKIPEVKQVAEELPGTKSVLSNNCSGIAAESDFFKLRKKMAAVTNDDDMVSEAKKYFKTKCFTTIQLKNLGSLFLTDAGKYKFFDAAYTSVSDIEIFSSLQEELKEEYYINRFKAMLK